MTQPAPGIVFVTQVIDPADPVLGFTIRLIRALRAQTSGLVVIANEVRHVPDDLDVAVRSLGKELGRRRVRKGARFQQVLAQECRRLRPVTLLAHMCPDYLTAGYPLVKLSGGQSMLWYTHAAESPALRRAERLADTILTALPGSYPRPSAKVRAIGHSIDTDQFGVQPLPPRDGPLRLVAVGRTAATKNYPVVIRALKMARERGADVELHIVGPSTTGPERAHREELRALVEALELAGSVRLTDGIAHDEIPDLLAGAHVMVNAHSTGSADKVVFEAMATGRPALVCRGVFDPVLGADGLDLTFPPGDVEGLARRITTLASAPSSELERIGGLLRDNVVHRHSVSHWAGEIVRLAGGATRPGTFSEQAAS